eukprot:scaffold242702_cov15-Prasinocladus_malaysianus.AAC.1
MLTYRLGVIEMPLTPLAILESIELQTISRRLASKLDLLMESAGCMEDKQVTCCKPAVGVLLQLKCITGMANTALQVIIKH